MEQRPNVILAVALASLVLGFGGDALLRAAPWGLNAALWIGVLIASAFFIESIFGASPRSWSHKALLGMAMPFALAFAWRDSPTLKSLGGSMVLVAVALASGAVQGALALTRFRLVQCFSAGADLLQSLVRVPARWIQPTASWISAGEQPHRRTVLGIVRGLLLAAPILIVFGVLFSSADPLFERWVVRLFDFDLSTVISHASLTIVCGWIAAALLVSLVLGFLKPSQFEGHLRLPGLGPVEVNTVAMAIDGLFLGFVLLQTPWFFGGHERVLSEAGLSYAEYARRGFFELAVVAALSFGLLLVLDSVLQQVSGRAKTWFRLLAFVLVVLTIVVIASALFRMSLYREVYGLTELRLYVTAFILWLAFAFLWLSSTLLRGETDRLAPGMLASGFASALALILVNPDALIVRVNIDRLSQGRDFDADYAASLSADALPTLIGRLDELPEGERARIESELGRRWTESDFDDWRAWSWSRHAGGAALAREDLLGSDDSEESPSGGTFRSLRGRD